MNWVDIKEKEPSIKYVGRKFLVAVKNSYDYEHQIAEWHSDNIDNTDPYFSIQNFWVGQQMLKREVTHWAELIELPEY